MGARGFTERELVLVKRLVAHVTTFDPDESLAPALIKEFPDFKYDDIAYRVIYTSLDQPFFCVSTLNVSWTASDPHEFAKNFELIDDHKFTDIYESNISGFDIEAFVQWALIEIHDKEFKDNQDFQKFIYLAKREVEILAVNFTTATHIKRYKTYELRSA